MASKRATSTSLNKIQQQLLQPFPPEDIEYRLSRVMVFGGRIVAWYLTYITARALHQRLDEVFGVDGWKTEFRTLEVPGGQPGIICRLWFRIPGTDEWLWRENGAPQTNIEPFKGGLSDAEKRAGAELGPGRYLYDLPEEYAIISDKKSPQTPFRGMTSKRDGGKVFWWGPKPLPEWALPKDLEVDDDKPVIGANAIQDDPDAGQAPTAVEAAAEVRMADTSGEQGGQEQRAQVDGDSAQPTEQKREGYKSKAEVMHDLANAQARPHIENIYRKYAPVAQADGWLKELRDACKLHVQRLGAERR